jgi:nitrogen fixation protein FixH
MSAPHGIEIVAAPRRLEGWHVLAMLLVFFGIVFAVNGVFLVKALSTHTGIVAKEPYVKGLQYNARIAAAERQESLGWQHTTTVDADGVVTAALTGPDGQPVRSLRLAGTVGRPVTGSLDRPVALRETEPGRYVGAVGSLEAGTWILALEAAGAVPGSEPVYRLRRRIWVTQQ